MFERNAEEYVNTHVAPPFPISEQDLYDCFQKAATFGYNKANEWHYVKDGKYPKHENKVLCILGDFENDNLEVGYYSQGEGDSKRWRFESYDLPDDSEDDWGVSAWKEIGLPKEEE